jgi:hypothetical protein
MIDAERMTGSLQNLRVVCGRSPVVGGSVDAVTRLTRVALAIVILGLTAPTSTGLAQSGSLSESPTEIVKRYVLLDQKGVRLDAMSFEALTPYIDWKEEPAWGRVVVILEAEVPEDYRKWDIVNKLELFVPVTYRVLGSVYLETAVFVPEVKTEQIRFHVRALRSKWRIVDPVIPPHIGLKRMLNFVREAASHEQEPTKRDALAALEDSLRKAK